MPEFVLRSLGQGYADGHVLQPHSHPWGQLIYAVSGTMQVRAADVLWLVPPTRALWVPAGIVHEIEMRGTTAMRTIYVPLGGAKRLAAHCHAIDVRPLLRELIVYIVGLQLLKAKVPAHTHLAEVFIDLLASAPSLPLFVAMPRDLRAAHVARLLQDNPSRRENVNALARSAGASSRTLQRIFFDETGMRLAEWRQRLRLLHAIALLDQDTSVTAAGAAAGYTSTSAFIAAFRQQMGNSPARYIKTRLP